MSSLTTDEPIDVLVVGAGASGAAVAWAVSGDTDARVVCLERGRWMDPREYPTADPNWELRRLTDYNPNPSARRLSVDYEIDDTDTPIKPLMFNGVGGSTIMWSAHFPRLRPSDFRVRSLDGVAADWPISYDDLEAYYELNDEMMGVAGIAGDPANPSREPRQTPPIALGQGGELLADALERLGWHWWPSDVATNSLPYGDGRGACNYCGGMELGCLQMAKASTDLTYWPRALENGVELRTGARVIELALDDHGRMSGATYLDAAGAPRFQPADRVVLACNAIGTARLLLASRSARFPDGLANSSGLVGRNLMFHPLVIAVGVFDKSLAGWKGPTACTLMSQEFYETHQQHDFARGFTLQGLRSHGPLLTSLGGFGHPVPWGRGHHERFEQVFGRTAGVAVIAEDLPEQHNRVALDPRRTDEDGLALTTLHYTVGVNSMRILEAGTERAQELLREAGATEVMVNHLPPASGFHLMGTTRMGDDPALSVVDGWGRAHDIDNLFIVDGGTFVTSASVNPTSTIQALALRTGHHIVEELDGAV
jgi:choline dehydrogenase-like flavoprotein